MCIGGENTDVTDHDEWEKNVDVMLKNMEEQEKRTDTRKVMLLLKTFSKEWILLGI